MKTIPGIQSKLLFIPVSFIFFMMFLPGCKKESSSTGKPGDNEVWMQSTAFTPSSITVALNTTVTWTNKDGTTHTVTSNSSLFDSGNIGNNGTYSHQFTSIGTFAYHCSIHSGMTGSIKVQ